MVIEFLRTQTVTIVDQTESEVGAFYDSKGKKLFKEGELEMGFPVSFVKKQNESVVLVSFGLLMEVEATTIEEPQNGVILNPWFSTKLADYLEAEYLCKWPLLSKASVWLVRCGLGVHAFKSNMLAESGFAKSKSDQAKFSGEGHSSVGEYIAFR